MDKFLGLRSLIVGLALINFTAARSIAADFTFTKIADTTDGFSSFFNAPAINDSGIVAFSATLNNGSTGVFTGSGGATTPFALSGEDPSFRSVITNPVINNAGTVAFGASTNTSGNVGVFTSSGTSATPIATQNFTSLGGAPAISNTGTVAFAATTRSGDTPGLFVISNNRVSTTSLDRTISGASAINPNSVALNNANTVVVSSGGNGGVFAKATDNELTLLRSGSAGAVSINNSGTYTASFAYPAGYSEIAIGNTRDATVTRIIPGQVFSNGKFIGLTVGSSSINDQGTLAFQARLADFANRPEQQSLYFNSYADANKIITTGDPLFGSTVASLGRFSAKGLNNADQVVFYAELADGRVGIFRAEPIPEPHTVIPGALFLVGFGNRAKLKRRAALLRSENVRKSR